ncbi:hypothetical protein GCM10027589_22190 [Actinocorallia lasiicapitis]
MDPITLAIAGAIATGIATGAGESTGGALGALIGRVRARLTTSPAADAEETATALESEFAADPAFREQVHQLWHQVNEGNSFTGQARNVVQINRHEGPITFS